MSLYKGYKYNHLWYVSVMKKYCYWKTIIKLEGSMKKKRIVLLNFLYVDRKFKGATNIINLFMNS